MRGRAERCHAALTKVHVNGIVEDGGARVADDGGEEDEGYDCVAEVVVCFQLTVSVITQFSKGQLTWLTHIRDQGLYKC